MPPFRLRKKARDDLISIAGYTEHSWGREQRRLYLKQLDSAFYALADDPGLGNPCDEIRSGYFKKQEGSHLIFYRLDATSKVEIIHILHRRMDVALNL